MKSEVLKAIGEHLLPAGIPFITSWTDGHTTASGLEIRAQELFRNLIPVIDN